MIEEGKILCHRGMSLRDYFAAKAMQGLSSIDDPHWNQEYSPYHLAEQAYTFADSMLRARKAVMP